MPSFIVKIHIHTHHLLFLLLIPFVVENLFKPRDSIHNFCEIIKAKTVMVDCQWCWWEEGGGN